MNPVLALIIANIIWGAASPIFKFALENIQPFTLAFIRTFFAGLIFLPFLIGKWQKLNFREWVETCAAGFSGIAITLTFFFYGVRQTVSINAPVIASSGPVFIFFLSLLLLRERPHKKVFAGMILSLIGVMVIILSPVFLNGKHMEFGEIQGNLFILIATFGSVFNTLIGRKVLQKVHVIQAAAIGFLFSALVIFPFMVHELQSWSLSQLDYRGWIGIIFGVFLSSTLAYYLYYYALQKLLAQEVGLFTYIDPVAAVVIAAPLLGEYPNLFFLMGTAFVFGGIYLAEGRIHWHPFHLVKHYGKGRT